MEAADVNEFTKECGSQYVYLERRGVMVAVLLTIHDTSSKTRDAIHASMRAGASYGALSGNAKASFDKELQIANDEHRLEYHQTYQGGAGSQALGGIVEAILKKTPSLDEFGRALAQYMRTLTPENAAPLSYNVRTMPGLSGALQSPWSEEKLRNLESMVGAYRRYTALRDDLASLVSGEDRRAEVLPAAQIEAIRPYVPRINSYLGTIADAHSACLRVPAENSAAACRPPNELNFPVGLIPYPKVPPSAQMRVAIETTDGQRRLLSQADSDSVLGSLVKQNPTHTGYYGVSTHLLLARAQHTITGVTKAWQILLIKSPYLDSVRGYIEFLEVRESENASPVVGPIRTSSFPVSYGRVDLPSYGSTGPAYLYRGVSFAHEVNPFYLQADIGDDRDFAMSRDQFLALSKPEQMAALNAASEQKMQEAADWVWSFSSNKRNDFRTPSVPGVPNKVMSTEPTGENPYYAIFLATNSDPHNFGNHTGFPFGEATKAYPYGSGNLVIEARDILGQAVQFRPYSFTWKTIPPEGPLGTPTRQITVNHIADEATDVLP
jgi:hypothetical protein